MLIDTHAHVNDPVYGEEAHNILADMVRENLERIVCVGTNEQTSREVTLLSKKYERVYATVGVHPSDAAAVSAHYLEALETLAKEKKCVAIGEIGLDYHYEDTDKEAQKKCLIEQIDLAKKMALPVVFHVRDAFGDFNEILAAHGPLKAGGIMHCYSGSRELAEGYVKQGLFVSFSGSITFKNNKKAAEVIDAVPLDRILAETDCPYLTPEPHRGKLNYPAYVTYQVKKIAEVKGLSYDEAVRITTENAYRAFPKLSGN